MVLEIFVDILEFWDNIQVESEEAELLKTVSDWRGNFVDSNYFQDKKEHYRVVKDV